LNNEHWRTGKEERKGNMDKYRHRSKIGLPGEGTASQAPPAENTAMRVPVSFIIRIKNQSELTKTP
jgi:hypothetical protein